MPNTGQVHWAEGLFLRPHHFQMLQRTVDDRLIEERGWSFSFPYGVIEAVPLADSLANGLVRFLRLRVVMPEGVVIDFPNNADVQPLSIKAALDSSSEPLTVCLGVPRWSSNRGNTLEADSAPGGSRAGSGSAERALERKLYRVAEVDQRDENSGDEKSKQKILVRRYNARLLLEYDDHTDLDVIPLMRVVRATGRELGLPQLDPGFAPPCLVLGASVELRKVVQELANRVEATRGELIVALSRSGFTMDAIKGSQIEQLMRLNVLNRYSARLRPIATAPGTTPFQAYLEIRTLLAELAALKPDKDPFGASDYDHDNPLASFNDIYSKAVLLLTPDLLISYWSLKFLKDGRSPALALEEKHLTVPNEYYLAIKSATDPREVADLVENRVRFKLMSRDRIGQAIPGVKLKEERAPQGLPTPSDVYYFRLMPSEDEDSKEMWADILKDKGMALRWPNLERTDFDITLYMLIPSGRR